VFKWLSAVDYTTWALWVASLPSTLTQPMIAQPWNYGETDVTSGGGVNLTGITASSTNTITIKPAPGESINDSPGPLGYYPARGVALLSSGYNVPPIKTAVPWVNIIGMQLKGTNNYGQAVYITNGAPNCIIERSILVGTQWQVLSAAVSPCMVRNNVIVLDGTYTGLSLISSFGGTGGTDQCFFIGNTMVRPSNRTAGGAVIHADSTNATFRDNLVFGFTSSNDTTGTTYAADGHNGTSASASLTGLGSTGNLTALAFTTATFVQPSSASALDLRLASGSGAIDVGVTESTNDPAGVDFFGTSRPQGSARDMGAYEFPVAYTARFPMIRFFG
jgi:hypothetical protein